MMENNRNSFTGSIGFILAAAGSAVGLGNIWRFPYLAARDGGGLFLFVYLILAVTFGFTLLTTEIAIGRKTKQSPLTAYGYLKKEWKCVGVISCLVPMMILPYYCVIGGWVIKYFIVFLTGSGIQSTSEGYFSSFITGESDPFIMMILFLLITVMIVVLGVKNGIEKFSELIMPLLVVLIMIISVYSLTLSYKDENGVLRTGLQGLKVLCVPDFSNITFSVLAKTVMDAMGQLFYSLSIAMGIMITYGSYMKDTTALEKSVTKIEIFDTAIAFLAGVMIIPSVYVFMGYEGMEASGPELMFVSLPMVFKQMGRWGGLVGGLFFAMVLFAAVTSSVSILEAIVSSLMDRYGMSRNKAAIVEGAMALIIGTVVCLGYNRLYFEFELPNGASGQILDIMDYISNNILMPIGSMCTCILAGWVLKPGMFVDEITKNGEVFKRKNLYIVMLKFIAPIMLMIIFIKAVGIIR